MKALSVKVNVEQGDRSVPFSPSLWASLVHPQQRTRPQGDGRGERTKGSGGWGSPANQQPLSSQLGRRQSARDPGWPHRQEYSKWDGGVVGKLHSCVVLGQFQGQFQIKSRQGEQGARWGTEGRHRLFWGPVVRGNPASSAPGQRLEESRGQRSRLSPSWPTCPAPMQ